MKANLKIKTNNFQTLRRRDPTGTLGLRRSFVADATRRYKALKRVIWQSVAINDVFALRERTVQTVLFTLQKDFGVNPLGPRAFEYERSDQKISRFMDWLQEEQNKSTMQIIVDPTLPRGKEAWSDKYIQTSYQQGITDSRRTLIAEGLNVPSFDPTGLGMAGAFNQPIHADRVGLIYTRTFNALKGVDDEMDKQISRILAKGLAEGRNPNQLAREMNNRIDKIGITRSRLIARTEIVQTHNEATLNEYEVQSAVLGEEILAEWNTAMDERVRSTHSARHGVVYTRKEALALIGDPNCRCALIPYIESIHGPLEERKVPTVKLRKKAEKITKAEFNEAMSKVKAQPKTDLFGTIDPEGGYRKGFFKLHPFDHDTEILGIAKKIKGKEKELGIIKTVKIDTKKLIGKQAIIDEVKIEYPLLHRKAVKKPVIVKYKNKDIIWDGHHRLTADLLLDVEEIEVVYIDFDAIFGGV